MAARKPKLTDQEKFLRQLAKRHSTKHRRGIEMTFPGKPDLLDKAGTWKYIRRFDELNHLTGVRYARRDKTTS